ncbi:LysR substrate-binding domain-containing protein [Comamonas humi]
MRKMIPSTQALACFESAARHESYTRAAQELSLTQSAVSRQIIALEAQLGLALFRRTRHGVVLTAAGRQYSRQVAQWLQGMEQGTLDIMAQQGAGGAISIAAVPTFATRWLLPRLPQFHELHPDVVVHIDVQTRPFLFAERTVDAAIYAGTPEQARQWPGTRATWLMDEVIVPVCSPRLLEGATSRGRGRAYLQVAPEVLATLPLLQQSTRPEAWRHWFEAVGVEAPRALQGPRYELFSMLAVAASHGMGVALIPPMLIEEELARGDLVVACARVLRGARAYYWVVPDTAAAGAAPASSEPPEPHAAALVDFGRWLQQASAQAAIGPTEN